MSEDIHARFVETARGLSEELASAIARGGPVRLEPRREGVFAERLARAVAGQQLSVTAAKTIWSRVEADADRSGADLLAHFHPGNVERLRACGLSGAKARTVCAIAEAAREGALDADALGALDAEARAAALTRIWGVGRWTADMMSIFWFADPDVWPDGDVAARKTLARLTSPRRKTVRTAERFAPHRSYLALYMWRHVDAPPET